MRHLLRRYGLHLIAFIVGFVIMTLEMVGSRILSPYFGASINTWAVLIGIILGSLSLGYWYGGVRADRGILSRDLSALLSGTGIYVIAIGLFQNVFMNFILTIPTISLFWGSILTGLVFFSVPTILLGMVNPYLAKLMVTSLKNSGSRIGNLSAISTFGNIVGTFSTSFLLIPSFGITSIIFAMGGVLIFISIVLYPPKKTRIQLLFLGFLLLVFSLYPNYIRFLEKSGLTEMDSQYGKIIIFKYKGASYLITGAFGYESKSSSEKPTPYLPNFDTFINSLKMNPKNALVIGGGTFNLSNYLLYRYPTLMVDSVEIDKKIVEIASTHFGYKENKNHKIVIEDGRTFINSSQTSLYDLVINDAFHDISPPHHLLTREAVQKIHKSLSADGIYVSNLASAVEGDANWLINASFKTISSVFPYVAIVPLENTINKKSIQSVLLVAVKNNTSPLIARLRENSVNPKNIFKKDAQILTDDYAPVEYNLISLTAGRPTFHFSRYYLKVLMEMTGKYFSFT